MKRSVVVFIGFIILITISCLNGPNDPPEVPAVQSLEVAEGAILGEFVGYVQASDPDGDELFFTVTGGEEYYNHYSVDSDTGAVLIRYTPDYEYHDQYHLTVIVSDGVDEVETQVSITVINRDGSIVTGQLRHSGLDGSDPDTWECANPPGHNPLGAFVYACSGNTVFAAPVDQADGTFTLEIENAGSYDLAVHVKPCAEIIEIHAPWGQNYPVECQGNFNYPAQVDINAADIQSRTVYDLGTLCNTDCWKLDRI